MNKGIKTRWLKVLRSGVYKQAKGMLRKQYKPLGGKVETGYCCLGVLTDMYIKSAEGKRQNAHWDENSNLVHGIGRGKKTYHGAVTAPVVMKWAGLIHDNPYLQKGVRGRHLCASDWNDDSKVGFLGIADRIEATL